MKSLPKRLLFVDDEANIRATLPVILRRYGFSVTVAATVPQALEQIKQQEFDVLLCDLNIETEQDGYVVIRAMQDKNPRCANIILTGFPALDSAVEGIHVGIDDYIMKPAGADALVAALAEKLAARRPKARILTVSNEEPLLRTWTLLAEAKGYEVMPAMGADAAIASCRQTDFDVLLLGSSISVTDKRRIGDTFKECCPTPAISIGANPEKQVEDGADYHVQPDPELLLKCIAEIVSKKGEADNRTS